MNKKIKVLICAIISFALISPIVKLNTISKANEYNLSNPIVEDYSVTWDCIYFGNYKQKLDADIEPIKWRVLSIDGDDAFLLSDISLYEESNDYKDIKTNLNEYFYNKAFTIEEQNAIKDTLVTYDDSLSIDETLKLFILSMNEVTNLSYGFNKQYNIKSNTRKSDCGYEVSFGNHWFLRSTMFSFFGEPNHMLTFVTKNGNIYDGISSIHCAGVRPALHLDLSKNVWTYADSVTVTTEENLHDPIPTPTIEPTPQPTTTPTPTYTPKPTPKVTTPSKPKISSIKNNKKRTVTLSWNKVSGASGYQLEYATNEAFSKKSKTLKATKVTINKLTKKKTYSFRVRAYALDGNKKLYSKWSTVKRIKIKK